MVSSQKQAPQRASGERATVGRLFLLDLSDDRIVSLNSGRLRPQGDRHRVQIARRHRGRRRGGTPLLDQHGGPKLNDGSIERADLDGRNRMTIVPQGGTFTPKQLQLDKPSRSCTGATARACA